MEDREGIFFAKGVVFIRKHSTSLEFYKKHRGRTGNYITAPTIMRQVSELQATSDEQHDQIDQPSFSMNDSKACIRRMNQRLDSPARIINAERISAAFM